MFYHTILMTVFGLLKKRQEETQGHLSIPEQETQTIRLSSAREVARLMGVQRDEWGSERAPAGNIQWISVSLFTLLEGFDTAENRQAFVELCIAQRALSRLWALGKGVLRAVQLTARQMELPLPPETEALFADFEGLAWSESDSDRFSSMYPNFALSIRQTNPNDEVELDRFLQKWDATLHVSGGSAEGNPRSQRGITALSHVCVSQDDSTVCGPYAA